MEKNKISPFLTNSEWVMDLNEKIICKINWRKFMKTLWPQGKEGFLKLWPKRTRTSRKIDDFTSILNIVFKIPEIPLTSRKRQGKGSCSIHLDGTLWNCHFCMSKIVEHSTFIWFNPKKPRVNLYLACKK